MMRFKSILTALVLIGAAGNLYAVTLEIANQKLAVRYDDAAQTFTVTERSTGLTFLTDAKLEGAASVTDGRIVVTQAGGSTTLELRGDQPFVFVTPELTNASSSETDTRAIVPLTFALDLAKPAAELRTMGTAGLTAPDKNPGSYLFLTCADPETRRGVVAGWVTQDRASGVLFSEVKDGRVNIKAQLDYGHLLIPAGNSATLETLAIGLFDDARIGEELYADLIKKQYDIQLRPRSAVYCSWYSDKNGLAGDEKSTVELATFVAKELKPFGLGVVQIDDEWQDGPKVNGPRRGFDRVRPDGPYPNGMAPVAEAVEKEGLTFGLWWLPFGRNYQDPEYKDRQDWFVKRDNGKPYDTDWGGTCLDLTHPEVQKQLAHIARLYRAWGVKYYKMDGLWTGAACEQIYVNDAYKDDHFGNNRPFHDPAVTNIESFRNGLKLLRKSAGDDVFFSGCCVAQNMREMCAIGLVDSMRVGPDYNADGIGIKTGPLRGSRLYFMNGRVWWNDPDPAILRVSGNAMGVAPVSLDEARLGASWVAVSGQFFLISDWLPDLPAERTDVLKRTMSSHDAVARPVDYFENAMPTTWLVTAAGDTVRRDVIGVFNWEGSELMVGHTPARLGLAPAQKYLAFDFWANAPLQNFGENFNCAVPAKSCRVIAVRADDGHPVLVSTSRHVTQGIIDVTAEKWDQGCLSATSSVVGGDSYELRIAGMEGWKCVSAEVSAEDQGAGVTVEVLPAEAGWLRVKIQSKTARAVNWRVNCQTV
jgi:hypothetical protein